MSYRYALWKVEQMRVRRYKTEPAVLLEQGREIIKSSDGSLFYFRVMSVNMVLSGRFSHEVGDAARGSRATIDNWVRAVDEGGFETLRPKKHPGRQSRLTQAQCMELERVLQDSPDIHGYKVWDGLNLSHYILNRYNIILGIRQCQRLFHRLGFARIRPRVYPSKMNEHSDEREELKKIFRSVRR